MKKFLALALVLLLLFTVVGCGDNKCTDISLDATHVIMTQPGQTKGLNITKIPLDTTDELAFSTSNDAVATVNSFGMITAVGPGTATITVTCGDAAKFCEVECVFGGSLTPNPDIAPTEEPVCADCGGKGLCANCGGDPICPVCKGEPECSQCAEAPGKCFSCDGAGGHTCSSCGGNWKCKDCNASGVCKYCEGDGICYHCDGSLKIPCTACDSDGKCFLCDGSGVRGYGYYERKCGSCDGSGNCYKCKGATLMECIYCDHRPGECTACYGDGKCDECYGDGSICNKCDGHGWKDCTFCTDGICGKCGGDPVCQHCGADGLICEECEYGKCRTCGGKNAPNTNPDDTGSSRPANPDDTDSSQPTSPDRNDDSWIPEGHVKCTRCDGYGVNSCYTCGGIGGCPNDNCILGKVDCYSCEGTGDCRSCSGLGENFYTDKECSRCRGSGDCQNCSGRGDFTCSTCKGKWECPSCHDATWCSACGGEGYI